MLYFVQMTKYIFTYNENNYNYLHICSIIVILFFAYKPLKIKVICLFSFLDSTYKKLYN